MPITTYSITLVVVVVIEAPNLRLFHLPIPLPSKVLILIGKDNSFDLRTVLIKLHQPQKQYADLHDSNSLRRIFHTKLCIKRKKATPKIKPRYTAQVVWFYISQTTIYDFYFLNFSTQIEIHTLGSDSTIPCAPPVACCYAYQ